MIKKDIKTNSIKAWVLAARPKTLTAAAVPVLMALSLAWADRGGSLQLVPAVLCLLFAFVMQIDANFVNDYFDYAHGIDDERRLGPKRACAMGWVTPRAMRWAMVITTLIAGIVGLPLLFYGGWTMVAIGAACMLFCFLYTLCLSGWALGDVLVLIFFGLVPVCATYYLQTTTVNKTAILAAVACGLVVDTLLMVNNFRDRDNDKRTGKHTLVVLIGPKAALILYFALALVACHAGLTFFFTGRYFTFFLPFIYLSLHAHTFRRMRTIWQGKALNAILADTARNIFIYGLLFSAGVIIDYAIGCWN